MTSHHLMEFNDGKIMIREVPYVCVTSFMSDSKLSMNFSIDVYLMDPQPLRLGSPSNVSKTEKKNKK